MLKIIVPKSESETYDSNTKTFTTYSMKKDQELCLEHSLVSVSKWESKWHKPFLDTKDKTNEELIDYVRCMTVNQNVDPLTYRFLTKENFIAINEYIGDAQTATVIKKTTPVGSRSSQFTTNELIYSWMIELGVPFECQRWHLNRLLTLIRVCNANNNPGKKMSKADTLNQYRALNAARRAKHR